MPPGGGWGCCPGLSVRPSEGVVDPEGVGERDTLGLALSEAVGVGDPDLVRVSRRQEGPCLQGNGAMLGIKFHNSFFLNA